MDRTVKRNGIQRSPIGGPSGASAVATKRHAFGQSRANRSRSLRAGCCPCFASQSGRLVRLLPTLRHMTVRYRGAKRFGMRVAVHAVCDERERRFPFLADR